MRIASCFRGLLHSRPHPLQNAVKNAVKYLPTARETQKYALSYPSEIRIVAFLPTTCKGQAAVGGAALPQAQKIQKYAVSFFGSFSTAHLLTFPAITQQASDAHRRAHIHFQQLTDSMSRVPPRTQATIIREYIMRMIRCMCLCLGIIPMLLQTRISQKKNVILVYGGIDNAIANTQIDSISNSKAVTIEAVNTDISLFEIESIGFPVNNPNLNNDLLWFNTNKKIGVDRVNGGIYCDSQDIK